MRAFLQDATERAPVDLHVSGPLLREGDVRVGELAQVAAMSRFRLTRQFQRAFGLPLHAYHLHLKLEESKRRLRSSVPAARIAADLGFSDQSHFHRRFKGAFGMTPDAWRRAVHVRAADS
jgi:AraC-like DNA-binding protein